jgi:DNA-directed RNA polymerase specialized sigma24 family protein
MQSSSSSPDPATSANGFATTSWSLVMSATRNDDGGAALDRLCRRYWKPIYVFARRDGLRPTDAEDATQEFFAHLLDRSLLKQAGEDRGSFRGFLFATFRNFLANRRRHASAQKRGGPPALNRVEIDELENIATTEMDPAAAYERVWAMCVTEAALKRLADEQAGTENLARFKGLRAFLTRPPGTEDYDRLVQQLGQPRNRIAVHLHRLTRRYAELIRSEVVDTLADPTTADTELRRLIEVLAA